MEVTLKHYLMAASIGTGPNCNESLLVQFHVKPGHTSKNVPPDWWAGSGFQIQYPNDRSEGTENPRCGLAALCCGNLQSKLDIKVRCSENRLQLCCISDG